MNTLAVILLTFPIMILGFETARAGGLSWLNDPHRRKDAVQNWMLLTGGGIAGGGGAGSFGEAPFVRISAFIVGVAIVAAARFVTRTGSHD
jgi:hypothetical protein